MTILNVNYRQFEEYHFVFAYKKQPMLLRYANQNCFILYFFWSCSPMQLLHSFEQRRKDCSLDF